MTYEEARAYIGEISKTGSVLGLESIRRLMAELSDVQEEVPVIHIAGTNGKGSTGAFLASVFQCAGLHVGRYCSPAVFDPLEVWQYDGRFITENEYAKVMSQVKNACDIVVSKGFPAPTVFEAETAAAFVYFAEKKPDVVLLETGMGGETDATNVIRHPLASVITTISMDHMQFLGNTLAEIARVKAGIIKMGCPVFSAPQAEEVTNVLQEVAKKCESSLMVTDECDCHMLQEKPGNLTFSYRMREYGEVTLQTSLSGLYQMRNASLAAETAAVLLPSLAKLDKRTALNYIQAGIAKANWPGRFEILDTDPLFILDGAHNEDAAACLFHTLQNCFTNTSLTYIIGVLADKEHEKMLRLMLPKAAQVYTVTPDNARALDGKLLAKEAMKFHDRVMYCKSLPEAIAKATVFARRENTPILAFGSLSYLGDLKRTYQDMVGGKDD